MHQLSRRRTKQILRWGCTLFVRMIDRTCMPISGERVDLFVKVYTSIIIYKGVRSYLNVFSKVSGDTMRRRTTRLSRRHSLEFRISSAHSIATSYRVTYLTYLTYLLARWCVNRTEKRHS